jgi:hypothetical protein
MLHIKTVTLKLKTQKRSNGLLFSHNQQAKANFRKKRNGFPRTISDQKFNEHVKDLCEVAGFKDKVQGSKINKTKKEKKKECTINGNYNLSYLLSFL